MIKKAGKMACAATLIVAIVICSLFAVIGVSASNPDAVGLSVKIQQGEMKAGDKFDVVFSVANRARTEELKAAGFQVALTIDPEYCSSAVADMLVDGVLTEVHGWNESAVAINAETNVISFVSQLLLFDSGKGYTDAVGDLFRVTLTAESDIDNPAALFDAGDVMFMCSDVNGSSLATEVSILSFTNIYIKDMCAENGYAVAESPNINGVGLGQNVLTGVLPETDYDTFMGKFTTFTGLTLVVKTPEGVTVTSGSIKTGYILYLYEFNEVKAQVAISVKGDSNGDGRSDIFDSVEILKYIVGNTEIPPLGRYAAKVTATPGDAGIYDSVAILKYILNPAIWG